MIIVIIQSLIITTLDAICCKLFFDTFFKLKEYLYKWIKKIEIILLVIGFTVVASLEIQSYFIKSMSVILLVFFVMMIYYSVNIIQLLALSAIYYGIALGIDYLSVMTIQYFLVKNYSFILNNTVSATLIVLLCRTILFVTIFVISKKWNKEDNLSMISNTEWFRFAYFPILTIISIIAMIMNFNSDYDEKGSYTLLIIAFGLVIMNIMVFYLIRDIVNREANMRKISLMQEHNRNQLAKYYNMEDNFSNQKKRMHDYKNQLNCIQGLLNNKKIEEATEYVSKLTGEIIKEVDSIVTSNAVVDTVLNQKYRLAKSKGITITVIINDLSKLQINEVDIVIILSNLLDNAIEACDVLEENKLIKFKLVDEKEQIVISTINPVKNQVKIIDNKIVSTKKNRFEHGIGLLNVRATIEKYGGTSIIRCKDNTFSFSAFIPHNIIE